MSVAVDSPRVGDLLRSWRQRRSLSQLELSLESEVSARHLSFIETGRARPSREMVLHLAERLEVPLRERNSLLLAAGFAPLYGERALDCEEMAVVAHALDRFLRAHEPYPALVVDRRWTLVSANDALAVMLEGVAPGLLEPPANVLRVALHPDGMAPRIINFEQWSSHLLDRLQRAATVTGDAELEALHDELADYPGVSPERPPAELAPAAIVLPLRLRHGQRELAFFSTVTTFGTPLDVTLSELAVEAFYPANAATANALLGGVAAG
ncbi:MAG TPA: helix-turn-helix transcriptional regulator [Solirubrobacteraceae bacterium]|nr:helix-turn-helix transcriptional regulator [Solirubrobacteraceae bacterium]